MVAIRTGYWVAQPPFVAPLQLIIHNIFFLASGVVTWGQMDLHHGRLLHVRVISKGTA